MVWVGVSALIFLALFAAIYWPSRELREKRRDAGYSSWQTMLPAFAWFAGPGGHGTDFHDGDVDAGGFDGGGFDGGGDGGGGGE